MLFYFCYLRKDISFSFNKNPNVKNLEEFILFNLGSQVIEEIPLRLTISPFVILIVAYLVKKRVGAWNMILNINIQN